MADSAGSVERCRHSGGCSNTAAAVDLRSHVVQLHCTCRCTIAYTPYSRDISLIMSRHNFLWIAVLNLSLGGMCYPGVPSMSQTQPPRRPPKNGDAGRVSDPPHGSEVGDDVPERTTRIHTLRRETMAYHTDMGEIFGDSFVDLNVKASRGRHGAERADPPTPGGSGAEGGTPRRRNRAEIRSEAGEIRR